MLLCQLGARLAISISSPIIFRYLQIYVFFKNLDFCSTPAGAAQLPQIHSEFADGIFHAYFTFHY